MQILDGGDFDYAYGGRFTGPVRLEMILEAVQDGEPDVARVHFSDGAVTNWHSHPGGQTLYLVSGIGRVGSGDDVHQNLAPGALVQTAEDEAHWHGADAGSDAVWLALTWGVTEWTERAPA